MRAAVTEYYRTWLSFDGVELRRLASANGQLDGRAVRRIGREYQISRCIPATKDEKNKRIRGRDDEADWIAVEINKIGRPPRTLRRRSLICACIARRARAKWRTDKKFDYPASAVSKLMWFRYPRYWTMFDDLAATAMGVKYGNGSKAVHRMVQFYRRLEGWQFQDRANHINQLLRGTQFCGMRGERIIDLYLMMLGADKEWKDDLLSNSARFRRLLAPDVRSELTSAADYIAKSFAAHLQTTQAKSS